MPLNPEERSEIFKGSNLLGARHAFMLLGLMTLIVFIGAFLALSEKAEAPVVEPEADITE